MHLGSKGRYSNAKTYQLETIQQQTARRKRSRRHAPSLAPKDRPQEESMAAETGQPSENRARGSSA